MKNDFTIRRLPETNQILITANNKEQYEWLDSQMIELEGS